MDAETLSEVAAHQGNGVLSVRYMRVAGKARIALRDSFGINLDELGTAARLKVFELEKEEEMKEIEEDARHNASLQLSEQIRKALGK